MTSPIERSVSLRNGDFEIQYLEAGRGPHLVYLHGAEGPIGEWHPFLDDLARDHHVIAPHLPGFGRSTGAEHLREMLDLTVATLDLLDALALQRPHLVGLDLGGMLAAEVAAVASTRIGKLCLVSPLGLWLDETPTLDFFAVRGDDLAAATWADPASSAARVLLAPPTDEIGQEQARLQAHQNLATAGRFLWPLPDRGLSKRLHRLTMPTLLVWGVRDGVVPLAYAEAFRSRIPGAKTALIENAGHLPMLEQRGEFCRVVRNFLRD
ncbi:MAG: alpha/beta hydrolase [Chloroflexota bacterium]